MSLDAFEVHIDLDGRTVAMGSIQIETRRGRTARSEFDYAPSYLALPTRPALDPATGFDGARHVTAEIPRGLDDAGPDAWGERLVLRAHRGRVPSRVDYLLAVDDLTRMGALRLRTDATGPFLSAGHDVPNLIQLGDLADAAHSVETDADDLDAVRRLVNAGSASLGGARPKASVSDGHRLMIAKFASTRDEIEVVAWEKLCLDLAARAGITVPASRLLPTAGSRCLVLDRFDRTESGRVPYLSGFAITDAADAASGDYLELAEALADLDVDELAGALRQLWRRAAFSIAMRNTDDHLKNHGVLWSTSGWRLSPAFDITPNHIGGAPRATRIDGEDLPVREAPALIGLARAFGIREDEWRPILADVLTAASGWRAHARALGLSEHDVGLLERPLTLAQQRLAEASGR